MDLEWRRYLIVVSSGIDKGELILIGAGNRIAGKVEIIGREEWNMTVTVKSFESGNLIDCRHLKLAPNVVNGPVGDGAFIHRQREDRIGNDWRRNLVMSPSELQWSEPS